MIWRPSLAVRTRLLSFNRIESRVVTDLLTGQTHAENIFTYWGLFTVPCLEGVGQRRRTQPTFCVSVKLWRHSDVLVWVHFLGP